MNGPLRVGSLFSGIGGFDLGLERAGMRTAWFCEQDAFCRRVLAHHWRGVPCHPDVTELTAADVEPIDLLCGGFPCQDLSFAGKGAGIDGARSGLWSEFARLIGELRPRYVVVENVPALLARGFERVLGDLAALGYDAEWDCLPARAFGAPHLRDRIWIVAYPSSDGCGDGERRSEQHQRASRLGARDAGQLRCDSGVGAGRGGGAALGASREARDSTVAVADSDTVGRQRAGGAWYGRTGLANCGGWPPEPALGRVVDGFPGRVDQLRALGNALVPQIAEWIGRRLLAYDESLNPVRF